MRTVWQASPLDRAVPQWSLLRGAGCNKIGFSARYQDGGVWRDNTEQLNPEFRKLCLDNGFLFEVVRDPHWDAITDAGTIARLVDEDIAAATGGNRFLQCSYCLDLEYPYRDGDWILSLFMAIRALRPGRLLVWTIEPGQGGWIKNYPRLVDWINFRSGMFYICPQTYYGDMSPWGTYDTVKQDIYAAGILPKRVVLFYDARRPRPVGWNGELFHAERLPMPSSLGEIVGTMTTEPPLHAIEAWRRMNY